MDSAIVTDAYDSHHTALHRYLLSLTRNRDNADDAVQEAFARLSHEISEGRVPDEPRAWLYQVGRNLVISRARRMAVADRLQHHFVERRMGSSAEELAVAREQTRELGVVLREQNAVDRTVLVMAAEGYGAAEIAAAVGTTAGAARTRLCRARRTACSPRRSGARDRRRLGSRRCPSAVTARRGKRLPHPRRAGSPSTETCGGSPMSRVRGQRSLSAMMALVALSALSACGVVPGGSPSPPRETASAPPTSGDESTAATSSPAAASAGIDVAPTVFVLPPPTWEVACIGVDAQLCRQMAEGAAEGRRPSDPPLRTVLVRCNAPSCSRGDASGETILIFADGTSRTSGNWAVSMPVGPPPPPASRPAGDWQLQCGRVPRSTCEEFALEAYESVNSSGRQLAVLTLGVPPLSCTTSAGRGETVATYSDGSAESVASWEYKGSPAP